MGHIRALPAVGLPRWQSQLSITLLKHLVVLLLVRLFVEGRIRSMRRLQRSLLWAYHLLHRDLPNLPSNGCDWLLSSIAANTSFFCCPCWQCACLRRYIQYKHRPCPIFDTVGKMSRRFPGCSTRCSVDIIDLDLMDIFFSSWRRLTHWRNHPDWMNATLTFVCLNSALCGLDEWFGSI